MSHLCARLLARADVYDAVTAELLREAAARLERYEGAMESIGQTFDMSDHMKVTIDSTGFEAALAELVSLGAVFPEVVNNILPPRNSIGQLLRVQFDGAAAVGAGERRMLFQPSDYMLGFLAALRMWARNGDRVVVNAPAHSSSPSTSTPELGR